MRTVAIVQARLGSTRLPGKVLMPLAGVPVVVHVLNRLRRAREIDHVVVATTDKPADDVLAHALERIDGVTVFRGSEEDVLQRYVLAARTAKAEAVVRVTADCPLIDPHVVDQVVATLGSTPSGCDYASNTVERTFPRGLDVECFTMRALETAFARARDAYDREHVTPYIWSQPDSFVIRQWKNGVDHSSKRWTLDTPDDYAFLSRVFDALGADASSASWTDVLEILARNPEWESINAGVRQKGRE